MTSMQFNTKPSLIIFYNISQLNNLFNGSNGKNDPNGKKLNMIMKHLIILTLPFLDSFSSSLLLLRGLDLSLSAFFDLSLPATLP